MTMEDVEKDVIPVFSNKRESCLGLNISFPWGCDGKKYKLFLSVFRKSDIPSRIIVNELLEIYPKQLFTLNYLEQFWKFEHK